MKWAAFILCAGCVTATPIGPYVKTVARNGAYLAVQKCTIFLDGDSLREDECRWEQVPLVTLPPPSPAAPGPR